MKMDWEGLKRWLRCSWNVFCLVSSLIWYCWCCTSSSVLFCSWVRSVSSEYLLSLNLFVRLFCIHNLFQSLVEPTYSFPRIQTWAVSLINRSISIWSIATFFRSVAKSLINSLTRFPWVVFWTSSKSFNSFTWNETGRREEEKKRRLWVNKTRISRSEGRDIRDKGLEWKPKKRLKTSLSRDSWSLQR